MNNQLKNKKNFHSKDLLKKDNLSKRHSKFVKSKLGNCNISEVKKIKDEKQEEDIEEIDFEVQKPLEKKNDGNKLNSQLDSKMVSDKAPKRKKFKKRRKVPK